MFQLTPAEKEWDYFRIIADYNPFVPSRTKALLYGEEAPTSELVRTIENLQNMGASLVAVPCNSAHGWYDGVSEFIKIPWLNLIKVTANAVKKRNIEGVLVIGAYVPVEKRLYDKYLDDTEYLNDSKYTKVYQLIEELKSDGDRIEIKKKFSDILKPYKNKIDGVVIACTELSMLFGMDEPEWNGFQVIDSTNEYAKKCVEICKGGDRNG